MNYRRNEPTPQEHIGDRNPNRRPNRLIHATSPYLLQHAYNPVDWYPWEQEAIDKARREDKPIFLSIGYSACHWCHVMERESFENEEIAQLLNEHFVPIKVDREERPDLDDIYMKATMLMNRGQGGWPMSVFLTPEGKPIFAGTYFPLHGKRGQPGFDDVLWAVLQAWEKQRDKLSQSADQLVSAIERIGHTKTSADIVSPEAVSRAAHEFAAMFDREYGGISNGGGNKFPPSGIMILLLRQYRHSLPEDRQDNFLLEMVELTLSRMADGGIYDQLGGGIARYSTDRRWLVPHFEKMLYDQALMSTAYLEAFQLTGQATYGRVAGDILHYVLEDLRSPEGAFYSARDADSGGVEGKYYVWSYDEIMDLLGHREGRIFCGHYGLSREGNWEGSNILNVQRDVETDSRLYGISIQEAERIMNEGRKTLIQARQQRIPPALDDKILASWNGLMIAALARGGRVLGEKAYTQAAEKAAEFILQRMITQNGRLWRSYRNGVAGTTGYLDDYALLVSGLLELHETTLDHRWLTAAIRLNEEMVIHFWDSEEGGFFQTADDAERLIVRGKSFHDGAVPSANSVALMNLLKLSALLEREDLLEKAETIIRLVGGELQGSAVGLEQFLLAVDFYHSPKTDIVLTGPREAPAMQALIETLHSVYDPYRVVFLLDPADPAADQWQESIPLLAGRSMIDGHPAVYVCRNKTCRRPVTRSEELARELKGN